LTEDEATEIFVEQIEGLREGGADVAWIETMSAPEEIRAAANAAIRVGMPYVATASFDTAGRTMMGLTPDAFAEFIDTLATAPLAFGANCGVGASDLLVSILGMTRERPDAVVVAKANAGVPQWRGAHIHYSGTPELMAIYAGLAIDAGARIVGGCCGTTPGHLAAMRRALDDRRPGPRPDAARIVAALGPLASPPVAEPAARSRRRAREGA
jgi:5-methyltetrahydrofolate--homocysteine methyltransferase